MLTSVKILLALVLGTLYALVLALFSKNLDAPIVLWPLLISLFWFLFHKYNALRFTGYFLVLPIAIFSFEYIWTLQHPGMNAEIHKSIDRSHYTPGLRVSSPHQEPTLPGGLMRGGESLIGADGFRADPDTGEGNPAQCRFALVGDSMMYGTGLSYEDTLHPLLDRMGVSACVLGVTGNSPVDYLATLSYAADRINTGATVAVYLYAYNDFISMSKYSRRKFLSGVNIFRPLFVLGFYFDVWRQSTWMYAWAHPPGEPEPLKPWQVTIGEGNPVDIVYEHDPSEYSVPESLDEERQLALKMFFENLSEMARERDWRVAILIHPADDEMYASFAEGSARLITRDPRRAEALEACKAYAFVCDDISDYLYERSWAAGRNPYFSDDLHFSPFGMQLVAEHFAKLARQATVSQKDQGN